MTQGLLDFGRSDRIARAFRLVVRAVDDAVDAIGLDVAAGACDVRKSELADALGGREHRHLRVEWLIAIIDASPDPFRRHILEALTHWQGVTLAPRRELKPEEKLARLERVLVEQLGPTGAELVERAYK